MLDSGLGAFRSTASPSWSPRHQLDVESKVEAVTNTRTQSKIAALPLAEADPKYHSQQPEAGYMLNAGGGNVAQSKIIHASVRPSSPEVIRMTQLIILTREPAAVTVTAGKPWRRGGGARGNGPNPRDPIRAIGRWGAEAQAAAGQELQPAREVPRGEVPREGALQRRVEGEGGAVLARHLRHLGRGRSCL